MATRRRQAPRRGAQYATLLSGEDDASSPKGQGSRGARHGRHPYSPSVGAYASGAGRSTTSVGKAPALIALAVFAIMAAGGAWLWLHRSVLVSVNGESVRIPINTTVDEAMGQLGITAVPGDLVSVGGTVLAAGEGDDYAVSIDGEPQTVDTARKWRLQGGEELEFGPGANRTEEYTVNVRETPPKLEMDGSWGAISYVAQWGRSRRQEVRHGTTSGEVADGDVLDEGQNCVVRTMVPEPTGDVRMVALTFDDGPSAYTQRYLDILSRYDAHATFFALGTEVAEMPGAARAVTEGGNELMSHTNQHLELTTLDAEALLAEVTTAASAIEDATGTKTSSIRPPYGEFDADCWLASQGRVSLSVLWTQDSEDWRRQGVDAIVQNALAGVTSGSIILMHDGGGNRDLDLEALPRIIEALQEDGYQLVTISELLAACPDIPAEVASGYAPMPDDAAWPTELA